MSKHTLGPWYAKNSDGPHNQALVIDEDDGRNVCVCYDQHDAPLVAAAPELLTALRPLADFYSEFCTNGNKGTSFAEWQVKARALTDQARAAIAKAKGEA